MNHKKTFHFRTFLTELMIDILLFSLLCACALIFFGKTAQITKKNTQLQEAMNICSNAEAIFKNGDAYALMSLYEHGIMQNNTLYAGFDDAYHSCNLDDAAYVLTVVFSDLTYSKAELSFSTKNGDVIYDISICRYRPQTLEEFVGGGTNE